MQAPTLVLQRDNQFVGIAHGKYIAERIPDARFVELPGTGLGIFQYVEETVAAIREFLTGAPACTSARSSCAATTLVG